MASSNGDTRGGRDASRPVGEGARRVKHGECVASIALESGHSPESLWNLPENGSLRKARGNPNVIFPGDRIHVPPLTPRGEPAATERRHTYRLKASPTVLRLVLYEGAKPWSDQEYRLDIEGRLTSGTTDSEGRIELPIPADAKRGRLIVGAGEEEIRLDLGGLDPVDTVEGVQGRLNNLGFDAGAIDGIAGPRTKGALAGFQRKHGLEETGTLDEASRERLVQEHGC